MTAISSGTINNTGFVFGDLLLSRPGREAPHKPIPSMPLSRLNQIHPQEHYCPVSGLGRKVIILSDHVALGWAGSHLGATIFLKAIKKQLVARSIIFGKAVQYDAFLESMAKEIEREDFETYKNLPFELLGLLFDDDDQQLLRFHLKYDGDEIISLTQKSSAQPNDNIELFYIGSEGEGLTRDIYHSFTGGLRPDKSKTYTDDEVIANMYQKMASILVREPIFEWPIFNLAGGGYEFVYYSNQHKRFMYPPAITFLYAHVKNEHYSFLRALSQKSFPTHYSAHSFVVQDEHMLDENTFDVSLSGLTPEISRQRHKTNFPSPTNTPYLGLITIYHNVHNGQDIWRFGASVHHRDDPRCALEISTDSKENHVMFRIKQTHMDRELELTTVLEDSLK